MRARRAPSASDTEPDGAIESLECGLGVVLLELGERGVVLNDHIIRAQGERAAQAGRTARALTKPRVIESQHAPRMPSFGFTATRRSASLMARR